MDHWGEHGMRIVLMEEIVERGLSTVTDELIATAARLAPRTYLSIDIDVVDPAFAPGTGTPEAGGLTSRELLTVAGRLAAELDLCAFDVVEVNPMVDPAGITALAAHATVLEVLAGMAARRAT
jgi:arginase family enzyme